MKTAIYVLSVLILVLGGVAAALWLTPAPGVGWHETRYGLHEGRELVRQTDRQGRTRYVVEDSLGRKLFHVPVRNCLLDVRFRDGQLHFRENATGRTGYIDPDGIVPVLYGDPCLVSACHAWSCTPCLFLLRKGR